MVSHAQVWTFIDNLAERHGLSASGLAKRAGLDATTFNPSKRIGKDGRERWPSLESLAKVSDATGESLAEIFADNGPDYAQFEQATLPAYMVPSRSPSIPMIGLAEAGAGGFFDHDGAPSGGGWDEVPLNQILPEDAFALEVSGDSMMPAYRERDVLIVSSSAQVRRGDRVVVRTLDGEVMAKILHRDNGETVELHSINPDHAPRVIERKQIASIVKIIMAGQ